MSNKSSENYLDNLLDSLNGNKMEPAEKETAEYMKTTGSSMSMDDEFLKEFESELESDAYKDYFASFEKELEAEQNKKLESYREPGAIPENLESILQGLEENSKDVESIPAVPKPEQPIEEIPLEAVMAETFPVPPMADESGQSLTEPEGFLDRAGQIPVEPELKMTEAGEPDLAGIGDDDLIDILAKSGDLSELGDILSGKGEISSDDGVDEISQFAENQMQKQQQAASGEEPKKTAKGTKKPGVLDKFKKLLFGEDEEEELVIPNPENEKLVEELSAENQQILKELEESEDTEKKAEKGKKKKDRKEKKTSKQKGVKKEKKPKPKKVKKPKPPKPPKEKDNTPPLPKGPVILILILVASLTTLVLLGTSFLGYSSSVSQAKLYFNTGNYEEAYQLLEGMPVKERDEKLYNQTAVLAAVASEYHAYESFHAFGQEDMALDSLICAAGRYDLNQANAEQYECTVELDNLLGKIETELNSAYGMTVEEAVEIYGQRNRTDYSVQLHKKLQDLGLE